jgi:hypothetical protein
MVGNNLHSLSDEPLFMGKKSSLSGKCVDYQCFSSAGAFAC